MKQERKCVGCGSKTGNNRDGKLCKVFPEEGKDAQRAYVMKAAEDVGLKLNIK